MLLQQTEEYGEHRTHSQFSKQKLRCNWFGAHFIEISHAGNFIVGEAKRIGSGKLRHTAHPFSFKYAIIMLGTSGFSHNFTKWKAVRFLRQGQ
jgi:hypothetical protein